MTSVLEQRPVSIFKLGHTRLPELDALRGLFLVWMTLTHLPTHLSDYFNQPLGFISSAEGFVFLSALLIARLYSHQASDEPEQMRLKLWKRSLLIYGYHVLMLTFAFTIAASIAERTHRPALINLLNFYLAHPLTAVVGSLLLIYCPPLLDILPMYVTFMIATPPLLVLAARKGWNGILATSGLIWLLAQFGLRSWVHSLVVAATRLQIPLQETGAFNLFAWQIIWILGLWIGATSALGEVPFNKLPRFVYPISGAVCLFFIGVRHGWLGSRFSQQHFGIQLDKWQIGPLRLLNLVAFACFAFWSRKIIARIVQIEPFLTLGKASLEVFCAHVFFVFAGLALLYGQVDQLHGYHAVILVIITFIGMLFVAIREANKQRRQTVQPSSHRQPMR